MLREVREGLSRDQKELSSKYFYDTRGSELFEAITELPEYYLTRAERALLQRRVPEWMKRLRPEALVELGAGSAAKTRILLDAMAALEPAGLFVPVDVSAEFLRTTAEALREEYPELRVAPEVADITRPLALSVELPPSALFALLGSTIGNFDPPSAVRLLERVRALMSDTGRLVLGVDLRPGPAKSVARLERAYNDARGVTAEFNLNVLRVLNRDLGTDFDPEAFRHEARWVEEKGRIEMHLVSRRDQIVHLPDGTEVRLEAGESIRTEISCKYDRPAVEGLFEEAGLEIVEWREDEDRFYALILGAPS